MSFRRLKILSENVVFGGITFKWTDVLLVDGNSHPGQIVKVGNPISPTKYMTHYVDFRKELPNIYEITEPISIQEIRSLRHHMTRRIWMLDGVFECINWQELNKEPQPTKSKLLPAVICYDCMAEGNKYIPKQLKTHSVGLCRCCGNDNAKLHLTRLGWPIDLRHKGFGFTVIGTGRNYTMNKEYYKIHHDMSIYSDYQG